MMAAGGRQLQPQPRRLLRTCLLWFVSLSGAAARLHHLTLKGDTRAKVHLNTFGFYANGTLEVNLTSLLLNTNVNLETITIGFSLSKSKTDGVATYTVDESDSCVLEKYNQTTGESLTLFKLDLNAKRVCVKRFGEQRQLLIDGTDQARQGPAPAETAKPAIGPGNQDSKPAGGSPNNAGGADKLPKPPEKSGRRKRDENLTIENNKVDSQSLAAKTQNGRDVLVKVKQQKGKKAEDENIEAFYPLRKINNSYSLNFFMKVMSEKEQGLYTLSFHNCYNAAPGKQRQVAFDMQIDIRARNPKNFLSAGEIPLPLLYMVMSGFFFVAAIYWVYLLLKHRFSVFKIHWLMASLAFTKSVSILFHAINYHFIAARGYAIEGWAVMYYITHLLKGALLFITLALIGTGWAFVKYILSDKDKKIFMIVIPLQVLANTAYIIIESTEEGTSDYALWKEILFLVDLICCGAILFPVVWSIRHLQEASSTDGKAAMSLAKLKVFRHFYVMIVCYIYFTRIIAILLKFTVPFQWQWLYNLLVEVSTLIFFILTGYKFRPASNNPYLQLPLDEEDVTMDEVLTESGLLENVTRKVKKTSNGRDKLRDTQL